MKKGFFGTVNCGWEAWHCPGPGQREEPVPKRRSLHGPAFPSSPPAFFLTQRPLHHHPTLNPSAMDGFADDAITSLHLPSIFLLFLCPSAHAARRAPRYLSDVPESRLTHRSARFFKLFFFSLEGPRGGADVQLSSQPTPSSFACVVFRLSRFRQIPSCVRSAPSLQRHNITLPFNLGLPAEKCGTRMLRANVVAFMYNFSTAYYCCPFELFFRHFLQ